MRGGKLEFELGNLKAPTLCIKYGRLYVYLKVVKDDMLYLYAGTVAATPQNLPGISAAFVNLLIHVPTGEIPLRLVFG